MHSKEARRHSNDDNNNHNTASFTPAVHFTRKHTHLRHTRAIRYQTSTSGCTVGQVEPSNIETHIPSHPILSHPVHRGFRLLILGFGSVCEPPICEIDISTYADADADGRSHTRSGVGRDASYSLPPFLRSFFLSALCSYLCRWAVLSPSTVVQGRQAGKPGTRSSQSGQLLTLGLHRRCHSMGGEVMILYSDMLILYRFCPLLFVNHETYQKHFPPSPS